jgi:predicted transposase YbfD/YdcC
MPRLPLAAPVSQTNLSIPDCFAKVKDPRRAHRRLHPLQNILVIALCAVIAGADDWHAMVVFGRERRAWLERFLDLTHGIPSHDTFERVFDRIQPQAFQASFRAWIGAVSTALGIKHVAIDGKTLRGSGSAKLGPLHLVSAWATAQRLSLGQLAVDGKSNEITAIPALLELLDLAGAIVTIDAMGCQKAIARQLVEQQADYVLTVKDNQPHLLEDIERRFTQALETNFAGLEHDTWEQRERGHGRDEYRSYAVLYGREGLRDADAWVGLTTIGQCYSERTIRGVTTTEVRYFIASKKGRAKYFGKLLRHHWRIENCLHWQLDVTLGEDRNRVQKRHAAENLAWMRRLSLGLLQAHPSKLSIAKKRFTAALNTGFLEEVIKAEGILENP